MYFKLKFYLFCSFSETSKSSLSSFGCDGIKQQSYESIKPNICEQASGSHRWHHNKTQPANDSNREKLCCWWQLEKSVKRSFKVGKFPKVAAHPAVVCCFFRRELGTVDSHSRVLLVESDLRFEKGWRLHAGIFKLKWRTSVKKINLSHIFLKFNSNI